MHRYSNINDKPLFIMTYMVEGQEKSLIDMHFKGLIKPTSMMCTEYGQMSAFYEPPLLAWSTNILPFAHPKDYSGETYRSLSNTFLLQVSKRRSNGKWHLELWRGSIGQYCNKDVVLKEMH
jgi:hypothetical protein